jgi:hypothetical protein
LRTEFWRPTRTKEAAAEVPSRHRYRLLFYALPDDIDAGEYDLLAALVENKRYSNRDALNRSQFYALTPPLTLSKRMSRSSWNFATAVPV